MAHYKRGKCRYRGKCRRDTETFYRKRHGLKPIKIPHGWWRLPEYSEFKRLCVLWPEQFSMMSNWPRAHDILHHSRPRRRDERRTAQLVLAERLDPDAAVWPLEKKPHNYYW